VGYGQGDQWYSEERYGEKFYFGNGHDFLRTRLVKINTRPIQIGSRRQQWQLPYRGQYARRARIYWRIFKAKLTGKERKASILAATAKNLTRKQRLKSKGVAFMAAFAV
jgi:hypothetical protein